MMSEDFHPSAHSLVWIVFIKMRAPLLVIIVTYVVSIVGLVSIPGVDNEGNVYHMGYFDAFYIVTYTATSLGFGELPYEFTQIQRMWMTLCIYLLVIGWLYAIGVMFRLMQSKMFQKALSYAYFKKKLSDIDESFYIIVGFDFITSQVIRRLLAYGKRVVVIEKNEEAAVAVALENYTPTVPVYIDSIRDANTLTNAGVQSPYCSGVISVLLQDELSLRLTLETKLLNPYTDVIVTATSQNSEENLADSGCDASINPYRILANSIDLYINAPSILALKRWIYGTIDLEANVLHYDGGACVIVGFGRLGSELYHVFKKNGIKAVFIEKEKAKVDRFIETENLQIICDDADSKEVLKKAGISDAEVLIAGSSDDTINLSVILSAKKVKKALKVIAVQNNKEVFSMFHSAMVDYIFEVSNIIASRAAINVTYPLIRIFSKEVLKQDETWGSHLLMNLVKIIGYEPQFYEFTIDQKHAPQIWSYLADKKHLSLFILSRSLYNRTKTINALPLMIKRGKKVILLPDWDKEIKRNDKMLFACDQSAIENIEYICQNYYEFNFALTGKEKNYFENIYKLFKNGNNRQAAAFDLFKHN